MNPAREGGRHMHLLGLLRTAGCIRIRTHLYALLRAAKQQGRARLRPCIHDGRDTLPTSGAGYLAALEQKMREYGVGKIASVSGRYYAMDRDRRWEREKKAFDAMMTAMPKGGAYQPIP